MPIQKSARQIKLEQLAERARTARNEERRAFGPRGKRFARFRTIGASVGVVAFANGRDTDALVMAAVEVKKRLAAIETALRASNFNAAANEVPDLKTSIQGFADVAGTSYDSRDGGPAPKQLVDALETALADSDADAAAAVIEALYAMLDVNPNAKGRTTTIDDAAKLLGFVIPTSARALAF